MMVNETVFGLIHLHGVNSVCQNRRTVHLIDLIQLIVAVKAVIRKEVNEEMGGLSMHWLVNKLLQLFLASYQR